MGINMKRIALIAAAAAGLGFAPSALAADLPVRAAPVYQAPVVVAPTWTGVYLGVNGGWGWTGSNSVAFTAIPPVAVAPFSISQNTSGAVFGGQLGYNWQTGNWVLGIEGDVDGYGAQNATKSAGFPATAVVATASDVPKWLASLRGRLGYTWGPGLIYITGGGAWANLQFSTTDGVGATSFNTTQSGWTLGGGYEWMFAPNWSLRAEYLYYKFTGTTINSVLFSPVAGGGGFTHSWSSTSVSVARIGLDYKFDWGRY
jgi:outer membrane immunogenic protein